MPGIDRIMERLVERAAKAHYAHETEHLWDTSWASDEPWVREHYLSIARAALTAAGVREMVEIAADLRDGAPPDRPTPRRRASMLLLKLERSDV